MTFRTRIETTYFDASDDASDDAAVAAAVAAAEAAAAAGDAGAGAAADAAAAAAAAAATKRPEKKFSQEQVNNMMGVRTKALNEKLSAQEGIYTDLLEQTNLADTQRERIEAELEEVQKALRTKEQQIEFEQKQAQSKFDSELSKANQRGEKYQNLFEDSITKRAITDAALSNDGCSADDFIAHLAPKTKIVIELDAEGQTTGNLVPMIDWDLKDEAGAITKVSKTPEEVVKLMQDEPQRYGHLFRSNVAKGIGAGTAQAAPNLSGKIDPKSLSTADFMEMSKTPEGRRALGLKN